MAAILDAKLGQEPTKPRLVEMDIMTSVIIYCTCKVNNTC